MYDKIIDVRINSKIERYHTKTAEKTKNLNKHFLVLVSVRIKLDLFDSVHSNWVKTTDRKPLISIKERKHFYFSHPAFQKQDLQRKSISDSFQWVIKKWFMRVMLALSSFERLTVLFTRDAMRFDFSPDWFFIRSCEKIITHRMSRM